MSRKPRALEELVVSDTRGFFLTNSLGDIDTPERHGLFHTDIRFLSRFGLTIGGEAPAPLSSRFQGDRASVLARSGPLELRRNRRLRGDLRERITLTNLGDDPVAVALRMELGADFAHIFQVRETDPLLPGTAEAPVEGWHQAFRRDDEASPLLTVARWSRPGEFEGSSAVFDPMIPPGESWRVDLLVRMLNNDEPLDSDAPRLWQGWRATRLEGALARPLRRLRAQALADLALLSLQLPTGETVVGAGMPYFMTLFGRDSLLTAYMCLSELPELAPQVLRALAARQGASENPALDEEPRKIPHEVRQAASPGKTYLPGPCYYGSVDATPLFLILLSEYFRRTADSVLLDELWPAAEAALRWIDDYGDRDGDGFIEYRRRAPAGLDNQGWKDSWDSMSFAEGALARGPIAPCEVQGYVYDAKVRMAELYRQRGNAARAARLERQARQLQKRFEEAFWMPDQETYALALDRRKRQVNAVASNPGHCLWSGIVPPDRAELVVRRMLKGDMFSGWGIRALASGMARYDPVSYHNGSVWPHDTALAAAGMLRYGFRDEGQRVLNGLLDAALAWSNHSLPELFSGEKRRGKRPPAPYPEACTPQAWGAAAAIFALQLLGKR